MITINGKNFAEEEKEFLNSLETTKACIGYAKRYKRQIKLFNDQNNLIGVITKYGVLACATKQADGRYRYSYATIKEVGEHKNYSEMRDEIDNLALNKTSTGNFLEYIYQYK